MATRSTIAIEREDGTVAQVYCHWDGYLAHNGRLLKEHYGSVEKIEELLSLGDISSLRPEIGVPHAFSQFDVKPPMPSEEYDRLYGNMTTFYGRDRGETGTNARVFKDFAEYEVKGQFEEYDYIMRKGVWYVQEHGARWKRLDLAIEAEQVLEDM